MFIQFQFVPVVLRTFIIVIPVQLVNKQERNVSTMYLNTPFTFSNNHDIAQDTVIELIQQEVDEEVSSLHRN